MARKVASGERVVHDVQRAFAAVRGHLQGRTPRRPTGRAVGAWVFSIGLAAAQSARESDPRRMRPAAVSYIALGVLELVAVARFSDPVLWGEPQTDIYIAFLASMLVVGVTVTALDRGSKAASGI